MNNEEVAGKVAELYGRTSQTRVEVVRAIAAGEYGTAISIAEQALGELGQQASELLEDAEMPESLPLLVLASALQGDLTVARIAAGRPEDVEGGVPSFPFGPDLLSAYIVSARSELAMAARRCAHGRATYTAGCFAKPPCPLPM
jgi:hypothetical protein